jgi:hypothetical protein
MNQIDYVAGGVQDFSEVFVMQQTVSRKLLVELGGTVPPT